MNEVDILKRCTGLNTIVDPKRLPVNYDAAASDLGLAVNIEIDSTGLVSLGKGYTELVTLTNGHSLFCNGYDCLLMQGTSLYKVTPDYELTGIRSGMSNKKISYTQEAKAIYYSNSFNNGIYSEGVSYSWNVDEDNELDSEKIYESTVPLFEKIAIFNGYMLGSLENNLYASEFGLYGLWHLRPIASFPSKIIMIKPVEGGVFISDEQSIYFLAGLIPNEFNELLKTNYPVYEWSESINYITDGTEIGIEEKSICTLFSTKKGICVGTSSGNIHNITNKKIIYPSNGSTGASLLIGYELYSMIDSSFCLGINLETNSAYQKTDLAFNSFCKFNNIYIGCKDNALCSIGGDDYNSSDIDAYFSPITTNFGYVGEKRLRYVYIVAEGNGDIELAITVDDGTPWTKTETLSGETKLRIPIPRSLQGKYWNFKISNVDGSYFNVDEIKALVNNLTRGRTKG